MIFFAWLHDSWWWLFGQSQEAVLNFLTLHLAAVPVLAQIGAYGLAIILLTGLLRLLLAPLQQFQVTRQAQSMREQRLLAPRLAELQKVHKGDAAGLNEARTALYKEHGINPAGGLLGLLPLLVQIPVLTALYWVLKNHAGQAHFLFVGNLDSLPSMHLLLPFVPVPAYLALPLLAAATTFWQSRLMMSRGLNPPLEGSMQQTQRLMLWATPAMIYFFAMSVPAGLGLYWAVSSGLSGLQRWLWPPRLAKQVEVAVAKPVVEVGAASKRNLGGAKKRTSGNKRARSQTD